MAQLIAQVQLGKLPVQGGQLPLQPVLLKLHGGQGDVGGFPGHDDLVLQVFQLPDGVGVVLLHVAVLDGVELFPHSVVGLVHFLISQRAGLAHLNHHPLHFGNIVQLNPQVLLQVVIVDLLQDVDIFLDGQHLQIALVHPPVQIPEGDGPHRVGYVLLHRGVRLPAVFAGISPGCLRTILVLGGLPLGLRLPG